MKNIIVIILIAIILVFSCEKRSDCYKCTTTFIVIHRDSVESVAWSVSDTKTMCDMTESKIKEYETKYTDTTISISGTVTTTSIYSTKCLQ